MINPSYSCDMPLYPPMGPFMSGNLNMSCSVPPHQLPPHSYSYPPVVYPIPCLPPMPVDLAGHINISCSVPPHQLPPHSYSYPPVIYPIPCPPPMSGLAGHLNMSCSVPPHQLPPHSYSYPPVIYPIPCPPPMSGLAGHLNMSCSVSPHQLPSHSYSYPSVIGPIPHQSEQITDKQLALMPPSFSEVPKVVHSVLHHQSEQITDKQLALMPPSFSEAPTSVASAPNISVLQKHSSIKSLSKKNRRYLPPALTYLTIPPSRWNIERYKVNKINKTSFELGIFFNPEERFIPSEEPKHSRRVQAKFLNEMSETALKMAFSVLN